VVKWLRGPWLELQVICSQPTYPVKEN
jgi:hypothetical protein